MQKDCSIDYFNERVERMVSKLKDHEFRITPQRMAVLRVLAGSVGHPSAEMIHEAIRSEFPTTSLATVYKTVHLLKEIGEVLEIAFPDGSNRYDGNKPYPHPHIICVRCKKIVDSDLESLKDITRKVGDETGFDILSHRLDFFGICGDCKRKEKPAQTRKEVLRWHMTNENPQPMTQGSPYRVTSSR
jgi:Fur family transcriptional regulator, peroxide stress response regulator